MGNSPSVSGPEQGRTHVKRDVTVGCHFAHLAEQRPVSNTSNYESELAEDKIELYNRQELVRETNRKLPYAEIAARPPLVY